MPNLLTALRSDPGTGVFPLSFDSFLEFFAFNGIGYPFIPTQTNAGSQAEEITGDFQGLVEGAYRSNGVVFACILTRMLLFSEARFQYRRMSGGRPGDLFGDQSLAPLEQPWPNGTTGDLLSRMLLDVDVAGNSFTVTDDSAVVKGSRAGGLRRLRPDWVTIVKGAKRDDAPAIEQMDLLGYLYHPNGRGSGDEPITFLPHQVAHFAPVPDPLADWRGMSWLVPVIREVMGDSASTSHKLKFFEQGATPNLILSMDPAVGEEAFKTWVEVFRRDHEGSVNAYKTMFLGGGASAEVVGSSLKELDFSTTQGHGETRIAAAARVPPIIVGLSEGLESATYSNYGQARRAFADATLRPLWRNAAGSLASIIKVPSNAELWYDDRDIAFLQEDQKDLADVQAVRATAINTLVLAGYEAQSAVDAVMADDFTLLKHTGKTSVQLFSPGEGPPDKPPKNSNGADPVPALPKGN